MRVTIFNYISGYPILIIDEQKIEQGSMMCA